MRYDPFHLDTHSCYTIGCVHIQSESKYIFIIWLSIDTLHICIHALIDTVECISKDHSPIDLIRSTSPTTSFNIQTHTHTPPVMTK